MKSTEGPDRAALAIRDGSPHAAAMNITMYAASVPVFVRQLKNACSWLDKAAAWATERKVSQTTLLRDRLAPDMLPLYTQFFIAADHAKGCVARLSGVEAPKFEDGEPADFAAIKDRLTKTLAFIESVSACWGVTPHATT